jgi:hypothetical protein
MMKTIRTYATKLDAEVARIPLERAGIPSMVVGIDVGMRRRRWRCSTKPMSENHHALAADC